MRLSDGGPSVRPEGDRFSCRLCDWAAEMRGGPIEERVAFLENRFMVHMMNKHPGQPLEYMRTPMPRMLSSVSS